MPQGRIAALVTLLGCAVGVAQGGTNYVLTSESRLLEGCFPPCLCPIGFELPLTGTFELELVDATFPVQVYKVSHVNWTALPLYSSIKGDGAYTISGDFTLTEQLVLTLSLNGGEPRMFDSEWQIGGFEFPKIDIDADGNNQVCFDTVFQVVAEPAADQGDLNRDGCINDADLGILLNCFGISGCGDLNLDGATDDADLGLLLASFGAGCTQ